MDANGGFERLERLSAFVDGEGDRAACAAALRDWCDDADCRRDWHAWQLIGDVLRSEDLASDPRRDAHFHAAVRARLALEPVVLAPAPLLSDGERAGERRPGRWTIASAVAAGFVLVVGSVAVFRPGPTVPAADQGSPIALADRSSSSASAQPAPAAERAEPTVVAGDPPNRGPAQAADRRGTSAAGTGELALVRDPQLDRYLAAHKQFAGTTALGVPSAFLRSATLEKPAR